MERKPSAQTSGISRREYFGLVTAVTSLPYPNVSGQQKTRHWRVIDMLPPRRGFGSPTQQESSAHGGRVSGDPIPIYDSSLCGNVARGQSDQTCTSLRTHHEYYFPRSEEDCIHQAGRMRRP